MFARLEMNLRGLSAAALVFLVLTLAACGGAATPPADDGGDGGAEQTQGAGGDGDEDGGGGDDGDPTTANLCEVVSEDEIGEIAGQEVTETAEGETNCDWTLSQNNLITVRYEGTHDAGFEIGRQVCDEVEEVSGVGDEAIWCPGVSVLYFNTGGRTIAVQLVLFGDPVDRTELEIATEIAELLVDRL